MSLVDLSLFPDPNPGRTLFRQSVAWNAPFATDVVLRARLLTAYVRELHGRIDCDRLEVSLSVRALGRLVNRWMDGLVKDWKQGYLTGIRRYKHGERVNYYGLRIACADQRLKGKEKQNAMLAWDIFFHELLSLRRRLQTAPHAPVWLHGTTSGCLSGLAKTELKFLPAAVLQDRGVSTLSGEHERREEGTGITGVSTVAAEEAIRYSTRYLFNIHWERAQVETFINSTPETDQVRPRLVLALERLKRFDRSFYLEIQPKVLDRMRKGRDCSPVLLQVEQVVNKPFEQEEAVPETYPIVFASTNLIPDASIQAPDETLLVRGATLGREIDQVYVRVGDIPKITKWLSEKDLLGCVGVWPIHSLRFWMDRAQEKHGKVIDLMDLDE